MPSQQTAETTSEQDLRQHLVVGWQILSRLGLIDYMGHASARVPGTDRVLIKPRHSERMRGQTDLTPERLLVIDLDGKVLEGDEVPPSERFIHTAIYAARPGVGGIVHTHQALATAFGIVGHPILPILHIEAGLVARGVPTYPSPELIDSQEAGVAVATALGDHPVCHLQGHGIVTVGEEPKQAVIRAIHLERLARANLLATQLGGNPKVITPEEIAKLDRPMVSQDVRWAYYASLAADPTLPANW